MSNRCRCGRVDLDGDDAFILNDTVHESLGVENGFCGPVINHRLRNAETMVAELTDRVERREKSIRYLAEHMGVAVHVGEPNWAANARHEMTTRFNVLTSERDRLRDALRERMLTDGESPEDVDEELGVQLPCKGSDR